MSTSAILFSGLPNSSEGTQTITFHELSTSSQVHQLKSPANAAFGLSSTVQNAGLPPRKTLACLPSTNSLGSTVLTISGKDGRNGILLWSTLAGKPTPSHRLIPPGRVIVVALSPSGTYLASGSADGVIMLWEIWSPLYPSSPLLSTFAVPGPAHHLAVDPLERFIIVSYATMLKNESQEPQQANGTASQPQQSSTIPASTLKIIPLFSRPSHAAPQGGVSRVHGPSGLVQQTESGNEEVSYTSPRSTQITALHLPSPIVSSSVVLCGLSNGKVVHLSMPSLQPLGQTVPHPNAAGEAKDPVVYLSTFARPADLLSSSVADALSGPDHSGSSSVSPRPVGVLGRVVGKNGDPQRGSVPLQAGQPQRACRELCTMLKIEQVDEHALNQDDPFSLPSREPRPDSTSSALHSLPDHSLVHSHQPAVGDHQLKSQTDSIEKLTAETVHLKAQLKQALAFNDSLWAGIVDGTLAFKESALPPS
ncbi:Pre-rRNA-processing protein ipi3 [Puccinia graminis f. sp. tritici]|uniref:Pre-rRNA-processing protein IPI3 n=1 Tax=Puccinia graminis f. sp. tritici TaxID=56615 RepID=A0A5B0PTD5_PUCGR|nr:Pre-rRNA-processing protein ipi3 [Puccinia graminis f. sp. tritici]